MKGFTVIKYAGDDAGEVLCTILAGGGEDEGPEVHEVVSQTQIGFRPNDEPEEGDDETGDD